MNEGVTSLSCSDSWYRLSSINVSISEGENNVGNNQTNSDTGKRRCNTAVQHCATPVLGRTLAWCKKC